MSPGPTEYACVLLMVCGVFPRLTLVNRVANWDFITMFVIPHQPIVSLSRQHNESFLYKHCLDAPDSGITFSLHS